MKKKILISIGCISSVVIPIATMVSCGTSWQHWNKHTDQDTSKLVQDPSTTNHPSYDPNAPKPIETSNTGQVVVEGSLWKVRDLATLRSEALDATSNTIDLSKVNNQFELNVLLIDLIGMKSPKNLESYWARASWPKFSQFISSIKDNVSIKLKYDSLPEKTVTWDIAASKQAIINGLSSGAKSFVPIEDNKDIYVSADGSRLTESGFNQAKNAAIDLMNLKIVNDLTSVDLNYAGYNLAMLVNLPTPSFAAFKSLLEEIGTFTNQLFGVDLKHKFTNTIIDKWISDKGLNSKLKISNLNSPARYPDGLIEGAFLLQAISLQYDNLK